MLAAIAILLSECGVHQKVNSLRSGRLTADLSIPQEPSDFAPEEIEVQKDTVEMNEPDGPIIMNAVKDENGEMTATDVIRAAMVTARFRNVAERHGKVELRFLVTVPKELQDSRWQLRLYPDMFIMEDSLRLEPVIITGAEYRKKQMRGYELYRRFLNSIITDPEHFLSKGQLEQFLKRNIPALYRFREDSTYVSEDEFLSFYGVSEKEALEHYTRKFLVYANDRRAARKEKMYNRYVKAPIVTEGIRLDTVLVNPDGEFVYEYVQVINTCPGLRKVDIRLSGEIMETGIPVYTIPESRPLTFYISSLSSFADLSEHYLTSIISRRVKANTACYVDFPAGSAEIRPELGNNRTEIGRIRKNISALAADREFDIDSIVVTASCSPEGTLKYNTKLSGNRAGTISEFFRDYLARCRDSLRKEAGMQLSIGDVDAAPAQAHGPVEFISRTEGENWRMLDALVGTDTELTPEEKDEYREISLEQEPDVRESRLSRTGFYRYLREKLYPRLRTVRFDFYLHRRGMVNDTVSSTVLDTAYMNGVKAISDRDYRKAISILRPYKDFNLAVAYCAMDYNASAMDILKDLPESDKVHYMLAILYSRSGNDAEACRHYAESCRLNPTYVHRGNLDPEISSLIKKYNITHNP